MKKIVILIVLFLLSVFSLNAQKLENPNTIYLVFQPFNSGVGIRYDRMLTFDRHIYGVYGSLVSQDYTLDDGRTIHNHLKFVSGVLLYLNPYNENFDMYFGTGIGYNTYNGLYKEIPDLPEKELDQWSFELSCNVRIKNFGNAGVRIDPMKKEYSLDMGFSF